MSFMSDHYNTTSGGILHESFSTAASAVPGVKFGITRSCRQVYRFSRTLSEPIDYGQSDSGPITTARMGL
jgi:hypothetical protein